MSKITNKIIVYPGRFQPYGPHHHATYGWLCQNFGTENVFIVSSDFTNSEKSPLTFKEKVGFMLKAGVPPSQIQQVKRQYSAEELLSRFDPNETAAIFVYGEKDAKRLYAPTDGKLPYFQPYYGQKDLKPHSEGGYFIEAPHVKLECDGEEMSGTALRSYLGECSALEFKKMMGWYDGKLHQLCKSKFNIPDLNKIVERSVPLTEKQITKTQLQRVEQYIDRLFSEYGIDVDFQDIYKGTHFFDRLNDPRNGKEITADELRSIFLKISKRYGQEISKMTPNAQAVMKDMESDINIPFIMKWDEKNKELDLVPKTIMRKADFASKGPFLTVESVKYNRHINHPFEARNLTCGEVKGMIEAICLQPENLSTWAKIDGQNIQTTMVNGEVRCARNKGSVLNPMNGEELRLNHKPVFHLGFEIIQQAMKGLNPNLFQSGKVFLNCEICHPDYPNTYYYDKSIYLHGLIEYDDKGDIVGSTSNIPFKLPTIVGGWNIIPTPLLKLKPTPTAYKDFEVQFTNLMKINGLSENSKMGEFSDLDSLKILIFKLGNEVILNNFPVHEDIKTSIVASLNEIEQNLPSNAIAKFKANKLIYEWLGGSRSIQGCEGFIFNWNGEKFKITGSFSPINQMLGILKYNQ